MSNDIDDVFSAGLINLDSLATVAVAPPAEFVVPIDNRWPLLPYLGAGGIAAVGERKAVGEESALGLITGGVRAERWQPLANGDVFVLASEVRYDDALTSRYGLLGDWGSLIAGVEVRRALGPPRDGPALPNRHPRARALVLGSRGAGYSRGVLLRSIIS